ncbi:MAG: PAS domain-containing protein [Planctomycetaceae bacterium]|nr:PAS domain-containing protein [Planctomycetaceae bacterium]
MFDPDYSTNGWRSRWTIAGLAALSLLSLIVTVGLLIDFPREQELIERLTARLPAASRPEAKELAGELRLQSRLAVLLIANLLASTVAIALLVRDFLSSQRSLRNVHVLASDILASLDKGVITTDEQNNILSINPRGLELLKPPSTGTEVALARIPPDHHPLEQLSQQVLEKHSNIRDWNYVTRRNGSERHLLAGCSLLRDHDGQVRGTVIHLRDITESTLMEQRLRRMERYMGLGSLAAGLQHEIKNPLSALSLHVQLLQESFPERDQSSAAQASLGVLATEVRRITRVLEGFRDFASAAQLHAEPTDLRSMIQKLIVLTDPQARQKHIEFSTVFPHESPAPLCIDPVRIEQVLLNLVLNAFAAMEEGGRLTIRVRDYNDSVSIDVADTGCGIPEDLRDKIFDPYFTTRSTGTGLGLALCEKIARQHGGTIDFVSGAGGTVFTVNLPRTPAE